MSAYSEVVASIQPRPTELRRAPQGWQRIESMVQGKTTEDSLYRRLNFSDFLGAFAFATQVALLAEKRKHHPDMTIGYNYVELSLTTHAAGMKLTPADYKLAEDINKLPEMQSRLGQEAMAENHRREHNELMGFRELIPAVGTMRRVEA